MTVSVVIPSYNGSEFIEEAILSVLDQERPPDEIILCDDNSSDDTLEICHKYIDRLIIHANPGGPSGFVNAWNRAIATATGDFICILHQDDLLAPEFLRVAMEIMESQPEVRHLFSTCKYIDHKGATIGYSYNQQGVKRYTGQEYVNAYQNIGQPHIHRCPGVITHRNIFKYCRYDPKAGHIADDDFFYRVGMFTDVIGILEPLASFRIHDSSETGGLEDAALASRLMDDYMYQSRQWKDHPFISPSSYSYFTRQARKYIRRTIGYGLRRRNLKMIIKAVRRWQELKKY